MARLLAIRYPLFAVVLSLLLMTLTRCSNEEEHVQLNVTTEEMTRSYQINIANSFLNYFFDELENGIDQVLQNTPLKDSKIVSPTTVASETTKLLKREVQQVIDDEISKIDKQLFQKVFGMVTAGMVAASAYAYMV